MRTLILAFASFALATSASHAQETVQLQNRVNLEDVNIQGEANKNQALFMSRGRFDLDERVKVRRDFRREINEVIPAPFAKLPETTLKEAGSSAAR